MLSHFQLIPLTGIKPRNCSGISASPIDSGAPLNCETVRSELWEQTESNKLVSTSALP